MSEVDACTTITGTEVPTILHHATIGNKGTVVTKHRDRDNHSWTEAIRQRKRQKPGTKRTKLDAMARQANRLQAKMRRAIRKGQHERAQGFADHIARLETSITRGC